MERNVGLWIDHKQAYLIWNEDGKVEVFFIDGANNPADMFTKNLGVEKFRKFRATLGLKFH